MQVNTYLIRSKMLKNLHRVPLPKNRRWKSLKLARVIILTSSRQRTMVATTRTMMRCQKMTVEMRSSSMKVS